VPRAVDLCEFVLHRFQRVLAPVGDAMVVAILVIDLFSLFGGGHSRGPAENAFGYWLAASTLSATFNR
jgi:hypothetical protein